MGFDLYEEGRLNRENLAEEIARAFHEFSREMAPKHGCKLQAELDLPWAEVPDNYRALTMAVATDLVSKRVIAPWVVVRELQNNISLLKELWRSFNSAMQE